MNLYFFHAMKDSQAYNRLVAAHSVEQAVKIFLPFVDRVEGMYILHNEQAKVSTPTIYDEHMNDWAYMQSQRGVFDKVKMD